MQTAQEESNLQSLCNILESYIHYDVIILNYFQISASYCLKAKSTQASSFAELIDIVLFNTLLNSIYRLRKYIHTYATNLIVKKDKVLKYF